MSRPVARPPVTVVPGRPADTSATWTAPHDGPQLEGQRLTGEASGKASGKGAAPAGPGTANGFADLTADAASSVVVGLVRTLRAAGVGVVTEQLRGFLTALDTLGPALRRDVYWAGRLTLCGEQDDLDRYDRVFAAYFGERPGEAGPSRPVPLRRRPRPAVGVETASGEGEAAPAADRPMPAAASATEMLRHRDIATLTDGERAQLRRLLAALALGGEPRRTARRRPARRGRVDAGRTTRELLRHRGEPVRLLRRERVRKPRRVVLLVDVSGSMAPYADALLRFAHAARVGAATATRTEVFTLGTRLTRVTTALTHRHPDLAMAALSRTVPDWSGGTRLGETLRAFLDQWGRPGLARGAVVVLLSDGWERADPALLAAQMRRLHRLTHRVVWANPRKGRTGYAPLAGGMAAALPSVDVFVEGHSLAALEHLAAVVRGVADA
ncbi:vWA domain-containing protein [Streptacidiphilus rugosus]|uniref:vWA domain-containing protein n=1 Tax=Streptacidiphilus rugosus TaxID=405783 RepID=UPI000A03DDE0|nr:VWA domain-containing protein [Streptacidiphilus rugosus]